MSKVWVGESEETNSTLSYRFEENGDTWSVFEKWEASTSNIYMEMLLKI